MKANKAKAELCNCAPSEIASFQEFVQWSQDQRQCVLLRTELVDIAGDVIGGIVLSHLLYWNSPARDGSTRLRIQKLGRFWVAKSQKEWWAECRISSKRAARALRDLKQKGFIEVRCFKFNGAPTNHVMVKWDKLVERLQNVENADSIEQLGDVSDDSPGHVESAKSDESLTKITSENSTKNTAEGEVCGVLPVSSENSSSPTQEFEEAKHALFQEWQRVFIACDEEAQTKAALRLWQEGVRLHVPTDCIRNYLLRMTRTYALGSATSEEFAAKIIINMREYALMAECCGKGFAADDNPIWLFSMFISSWKKRFAGVFEREYQVTKQDRSACCDYASRGSDLSVQNLLCIAEECWERRNYEKPSGFDKYFWSRRVCDIAGFLKSLEKIRAELNW